MAALYAEEAACGRCNRSFLREDPRGHAVCLCGAEARVYRFRPFRAEAPKPSAPLGLEGADTPCAYHAGNAASTSCARCGSFVCELCATPVGGSVSCPPCFERQRRGEPGGALGTRLPAPHALALLLGLLSLPLWWLSPLTLPLSAWQVVRARRYRDALRERERLVMTRAWTGLGLTLLGLAILVAAVVGLLAAGRGQ